MKSNKDGSLVQEDILKLVQRSMEEDLPLYRVLESVEKAILTCALQRHTSLTRVHEALRIPKATFFAKKKRFFE